MFTCFPDVGQDLLSMCQRNVTINRHLTEAKGEPLQVTHVLVIVRNCLISLLDAKSFQQSAVALWEQSCESERIPPQTIALKRH